MFYLLRQLFATPVCLPCGVLIRAYLLRTAAGNVIEEQQVLQIKRENTSPVYVL